MNYLILKMNQVMPWFILLILLAASGSWGAFHLVERSSHHSAGAPRQISLHALNRR